MKWLPMLLVVVIASLAGCVSTTKSLQGEMPKEEELSGYKGWSKEAVQNKFGKPYYKSPDGKIWEYKKQSGSGLAKLAAFTSFGLAAGDNAAKVDILRFYFKGEKVAASELIEDTYNIDSEGKRMIAQMQGGGNRPITVENEEPPTNPAVKKHVSPPEPAPTPAPAPTSAPVAQASTVTAKEATNYKNCTIKEARKRIVDKAAKHGLKASEKDGKVFLSDGESNIIATFKASSKKDVRVELKATGSSEEKLTEYFCKILESCN